MDMTYNCDKCGKPLDFNPNGDPKNKIAKNKDGEVICGECVEGE